MKWKGSDFPVCNRNYIAISYEQRNELSAGVPGGKQYSISFSRET